MANNEWTVQKCMNFYHTVAYSDNLTSKNEFQIITDGAWHMRTIKWTDKVWGSSIPIKHVWSIFIYSGGGHPPLSKSDTGYLSYDSSLGGGLHLQCLLSLYALQLCQHIGSRLSFKLQSCPIISLNVGFFCCFALHWLSLFHLAWKVITKTWVSTSEF